jgi:NAD(P)-dependent dehydrogenase (short-subunit alcohol dehydrogenase family)
MTAQHHDMSGKTVMIVGDGDDAHRKLVMAAAEDGAAVAVAGLAPELFAEAALHSIANEVWAIGARACVITLASLVAEDIAAGASRVEAELGKPDLVLFVED